MAITDISSSMFADKLSRRPVPVGQERYFLSASDLNVMKAAVIEMADQFISGAHFSGAMQVDGAGWYTRMNVIDDDYIKGIMVYGADDGVGFYVRNTASTDNTIVNPAGLSQRSGQYGSIISLNSTQVARIGMRAIGGASGSLYITAGGDFNGASANKNSVYSNRVLDISASSYTISGSAVFAGDVTVSGNLNVSSFNPTNLDVQTINTQELLIDSVSITPVSDADRLLMAEPVTTCDFIATYSGSYLTREAWNIGDWDIRRIDYTYDGSGFLTQANVTAYDGVTGALIGTMLYQYTYSDGVLVSCSLMRDPG